MNEVSLSELIKSVGRELICRACLSQSSKDFMTPLLSKKNIEHAFEEPETNIEIGIIFSRYTSIIIMDSDKLPTNLCANCVNYLWKISAFRKQCRESEALLQNVIGKQIDIVNGKKTICRQDKNRDENEHISKSFNEDWNLNKLPNSISDEEYCDTNFQVSENDKYLLANNELECSVCGYFFKSSILLLQHRKIHGKKVHQCITCGNGFTTTRGLNMHLRIHTGEKPEICNICKKAFSDPRALQDHSKSHTGLKQYQCDNCNKRFLHKRVLQHHMQTHTGVRPYACDLCDKSYIQRNSLTIHRRTHTGERPYACVHCGKNFTSRGSLSLHMPVHTEVKAYVCTWCGKRLARSGDLTVHARTHTGEKPYSCTEARCGKAFAKSSSLQAHLLTHTGEKKYICPICGHRVAHAGKLTVHMRTHGKDKPHSCTECGKKFANKNYLTQHAKVHSEYKKYQGKNRIESARTEPSSQGCNPLLIVDRPD